MSLPLHDYSRCCAARQAPGTLTNSDCLHAAHAGFVKHLLHKGLGIGSEAWAEEPSVNRDRELLNGALRKQDDPGGLYAKAYSRRWDASWDKIPPSSEDVMDVMDFGSHPFLRGLDTGGF